MKKMLILVLFLSTNIYICEGQYYFDPSWGINVEVGLNKFDGDIPQSSKSLLPSSNLGAALGIGVNYQMTRICGIVLNCNYIPISALTKGWGISTKINTISLSTSVDFTHLLFPHSESRITLNGSIGLGVAYYLFDVSNIDDDSAIKGYGLATIVPMSLYSVYNCSNNIDIGLKLTYTSSNKDNLEGVEKLDNKGISRDNFGILSFLFIYKF